MLLSEWEKMAQVFVRYVDFLALQLLNGLIHLGRVPQRDGGADEV